MPDKDDVIDAKNFHLNIPAKTIPFFLKGSHALDWGMQNRLSRIFSPKVLQTTAMIKQHWVIILTSCKNWVVKQMSIHRKDRRLSGKTVKIISGRTGNPRRIILI